MPLYDYYTCGAGGVNASLEMAGNVTKAHISEFPIGTYKKAHRHGPGAHLVILSGEGFSLLWNDNEQSDLRKADWKVGGMVVVPADLTFHQHFNGSPTRARYLALRPGTGLPLPMAGEGWGEGTAGAGRGVWCGLVISSGVEKSLGDSPLMVSLSNRPVVPARAGTSQPWWGRSPSCQRRLGSRCAQRTQWGWG